MLRMIRRRRAPRYPAGSCTEFVWSACTWVPRGWGDALQWPASAHAAGLVVSDEPIKHAVAVWAQGRVAGPYGHVAVVVDVDDDGVFTVWESYANGPNPTRDARFGPGASAWFIHPPVDQHVRLPDGTAGAGRGDSVDPVVSVVQAYETMRAYYNLGAAVQLLGLAAVGVEYNTLL